MQGAQVKHPFWRWSFGQQRNKRIFPLRKCPRSCLTMRTFYYFDRFSEYPTKADGGYSEKRSNFFASLFRFSQTLIDDPKNATKGSCLSKKWHRPRSPPRKSESGISLSSDFRRHKKCSKYQLLKFLPTFFKITK